MDGNVDVDLEMDVDSDVNVDSEADGDSVWESDLDEASGPETDTDSAIRVEANTQLEGNIPQSQSLTVEDVDESMVERFWADSDVGGYVADQVFSNDFSMPESLSGGVSGAESQDECREEEWMRTFGQDMDGLGEAPLSATDWEW